ncbi:MAG: hypothetical protein RMK01_12265 [Thermomicrobium sp.]|nr:hypothetical protein [Thermomicrobium sp.]
MDTGTAGRSRTGLYLLGCIGALLALACTLALGAGSGYFAWQTWQEIEPTLSAVAGGSPTPVVFATASPRPQPSPTRQPSPTPRPVPTASPMPTATLGPVIIKDWPFYEDPGYIRFQHPPNWLVLTTPEAPEYNRRTCHCYWIVMSEQMVQNGPDAETVKDWFNSRSLDDLLPGSVYMEILRLDSEYAPQVSFGTPEDQITIGGQYQADVYSLDAQYRIVAFRYTDGKGHPWVIVVRLPSGLDENNPQVQRMIGILTTIDHR